jgi:hypothetical protein
MPAMSEPSPRTVILTSRIAGPELRRLASEGFGEMVKFVADVERGVIALGGELHADQEQVLLEAGSRNEDLWGGNYYPGRGREHCVEFTSFINIRPARGNHGMEIADSGVRERVRALVFQLIDEGGAS